MNNRLILMIIYIFFLQNIVAQNNSGNCNCPSRVSYFKPKSKFFIFKKNDRVKLKSDSIYIEPFGEFNDSLCIIVNDSIVKRVKIDTVFVPTKNRKIHQVLKSSGLTKIKIISLLDLSCVEFYLNTNYSLLYLAKRENRYSLYYTNYQLFFY